jgi:glycerophosphoryl diester phosphodiesterase
LAERPTPAPDVHPESVLRAPDGRLVQLKVHRARWDDALPENSLAALAACLAARVARAEIDIAMLADREFLVFHDDTLDRGTTGRGRADALTADAARALRLRGRGTGDRPGESTEHPLPLLGDVVALLRETPAPTVLELDAKDAEPWPWPRVEELARAIEPVKDRVVVGGGADWNLRRLLAVDPSAPVGFDPMYELDWAPVGRPLDELPGVRGAYGYLDAHPLARRRRGPTADYLRDRLGAILRLVPGARDLHLRLRAAERMLDDGLDDLAAIVHDHGMRLDVWTLDAGTPAWEARLARAVAAGADIVTTNTPRALAAVNLASRERPAQAHG